MTQLVSHNQSPQLQNSKLELLTNIFVLFHGTSIHQGSDYMAVSFREELTSLRNQTAAKEREGVRMLNKQINNLILFVLRRIKLIFI